MLEGLNDRKKFLLASGPFLFRLRKLPGPISDRVPFFFEALRQYPGESFLGYIRFDSG